MIVIIVIAVLAILLLVGLFLITSYNGLVKSRLKADEAWSGILVQLKRRLDLIPGLVNTVKGYAKHESQTLQKIVEERSKTIQSGSPTSVADAAQTENMLAGALKSVFAVAESHPDLKASQNFIELQTELTDTEDKIQASRRFYNSAVTELNTKIQSFPSSIVAGAFNFQTKEFFNLDQAEQAAAQKPVEVSF
jgi:LemA protein